MSIARLTASLPLVQTGATARDYWKLLKPGVMLLVVFTGAVGLLTAPAQPDFITATLAIIAIALGSGGGAAINMWYDADIDRIMRRTQKRPIPAGLIAEDDVLALGLIMSALSVTMLGLATNWAAAALLAFAIWFYACFYTMLLKRRTAQNIVIGGAAGAFPPVIGWLAVHPVLSLEPILYFLIIFFWTPPHFWALALYRHQDYADADIPMLPVVAGEASTLRHIVGYSIVLFAVTLLPTLCGFASYGYLIAAILLSGLFLLKAIILYRAPDDTHAMGLFKYSIFYLFLLFVAILCDHMFFSPATFG